MLAWAAFTLFGGVDYRDFGQHLNNGDPAKLKTPILAQSFVSTHNNLSRIELELSPALANSLPGDMSAWLGKGDGPESLSLDTATVGVARIISNSGVTLLSVTFPPLDNTAGITCTFMLLTPGYSVNSALSPMWSTIDTISSGAMYTEDGPQAGDLSITTYYRYNLFSMLGDTLDAVANHLNLFVVWLLLLLLPGLALLLCLPNKLNTGQRVLAAPGLSVLLLPLILLVASFVRFPLGPNKLWLLLGLCAAAIVLQVILGIRNNPQRVISNPRSTSIVFWIAFGAIIAFTLMTHLASLRDVQAGVGMDAYHHTMITALFIRDSGIPTNYEPYAPLSSFTYHFGFHTLSAIIAWLTNSTQPTDLMTLVPQVGQIAGSVLPIPALTLFGWRILGNRWVGLIAGGLAGLVSIVPAFYVEWSRYTQGLGLAALPVAWVLFVEAVGNWKHKADRNQKPKTENQTPEPLIAGRWPRSVVLLFLGRVILAVIGSAGLFLTHYRITVLYAGFAALYVVYRALMDPREGSARPLQFRISRLLRYGSRAALIGALSLLLLLPWLINFTTNFVKNIVDRTDVDVYYALAERIGPTVMSHYSVAFLSIMAACGLFIIGLRCSFRCMVISFVAGILGASFGVYIWLNRNPAMIEGELRYLFLGLSPVTWFLVLEILTLCALALFATDQKADIQDNREILLVLPSIAWLVLALWSSPQLFPFRIQGAFIGYLDAVTLASGAWLPACLLAAFALVSVWRWWAQDEGWKMQDDRTTALATPASRNALSLTLSALAIISLASGLALSPLNERQPYIEPTDKAALLWMRDNLPPNSHVLANAFNFPWTPDQPLGSDSGLWLPLISNVRSTVTSINAYNEQTSDPSYFTLARQLAPLKAQPAATIDWQAVKAQGIDYVYIGSRGVSLGFYVPDLLADSRLQLILHNNSVWLFKIP